MLRGRGDELHLVSALPGAFNVTNTALAAAMLVESGIPATELSAIGRTFTAAVPGRMEQVAPEAPFLAVVDYAHKPGALRAVLETLRALRGQDLRHELIAVFSTQEEVGLRGAITAAYGAEPTVGIGLDVTLAVDTPGVPAEDQEHAQ